MQHVDSRATSSEIVIEMPNISAHCSSFMSRSPQFRREESDNLLIKAKSGIAAVFFFVVNYAMNFNSRKWTGWSTLMNCARSHRQQWQRNSHKLIERGVYLCITGRVQIEFSILATKTANIMAGILVLRLECSEFHDVQMNGSHCWNFRQTVEKRNL